MKQLGITLALSVAAAVLAGGCGGVVPQPMETLGDSVRIYNEGVRWEKWEKAANFLPPKQRTKWVDESDERAKDLRITEYDLVQIEPKGDKEAKVHIKMSWYKNSEGTVHETHALQTWEKHGHDWWVVDETRLRGYEMPGLSEPLMKDGDGSDGSGGSAKTAE